MLTLLLKSFHIISMVAWFAGLFYLPRLFVYHAQSTDLISRARFKIMEKKLYFYIMTPAAILTTIFGIGLFLENFSYYQHQRWMAVKLILVLALWGYHFYCGKLLRQFSYDKNRHTPTFYRYFNEIPTLLLIAIVLLVVIKP